MTPKPTSDFTKLRPGTVLCTWDGGQQIATVCPHCGRVAKPKVGLRGTVYVHSVLITSGSIHTQFCAD